jgi:hypothetical protein
MKGKTKWRPDQITVTTRRAKLTNPTILEETEEALRAMTGFSSSEPGLNCRC